MSEYAGMRGLGLPLTKRKQGYFTSKTRNELAFSDLLIAVFTPLGTRPGNRSFGSGVHRALFEPTVTAAAFIRAVIIDAAQQWVPHVVVLDVSVSETGTMLDVSVSFRLAEDTTATLSSVRLSRRDVEALA